MDIKTTHGTQDASTNIFLTGAILFANLDYGGLLEYALKAAIGGLVWMGFKLASDWIGEKIKSKKNENGI